MQKHCSDELDLFLLKKNISGSGENTLRTFHEFFRNQKKHVDMSYFLKQPVIEQAKEIDEDTKWQLETLAPEEKAFFRESYYKRNVCIKNLTFANLYLHEYAVFMNELDNLKEDWKRLKREFGSRFYKNHVLLVEYNNKNRTFSLVKRPKGRPRVEDFRKRISLRVDKDLFRLIEAYSKQNHLTQQEFLLEAITSLVKPKTVAAENPVFDIMMQRYDVDGNMQNEIEKMQKIISKKHEAI